MATTTYILELKDLITNKIKNIKSAFADTTRSANGANSAIRILPNSIKGLEKRLEELRQKQSQAFTINGIRQYRREIEQTQRQLSELQRHAGTNTSENEGVSLKGVALGALGLVSVGGLVALGQEVIMTTAKYEKFHAVLQNTFSSHSKATEGMDMLNKWAANTPYQIDQATDSFIKLQNDGVNPTYQSMTQLGDLAASKGKELDQLTEALLDAKMGEFERLKEFGIKGATNKNSYSFTFKGQTTEVKKSAEAVQEYVLSLGNLKGIQGSMAAISQTTEGQISNLADAYDQLKNAMGQTVSGPVKNTITGLTGIVNGVKSWFEIPTEEKLRGEQAEINGLVGAITKYNPESEQRNLLLGELVQKYPELFNGIDAEMVKNEELEAILMRVNGQYERRIDLAKTQSQMGVVEEQYKQFAEGVSFIQNKMALLDAIDSATSDEVKQSYIDAYNKDNALKYGGLFGTKDTKTLRSQLQEQMGTEQETANVFKKQVDNLKEKQKSQELSLFLQKTMDFKTAGIFKSAAEKKRFMQLYNNNDLQGEAGKELQSIMDGTWGGSKSMGGLGGSSGGSHSLGAGEITGGRQVKNINIQIDKLVGEFSYNNTSVKESKEEVKKIVYEALMESVNDVNAAN